MMALGSSGGPSSNLSASAPPFTIDRFSSKTNSDHVLQYGDASYATPFGHDWQYRPIPSAPQPEVEADSMRTTSMPISSDYTYRAAGSFNPISTQWPSVNPGDTSSNTGFYVSEARSYHPPFGSPVVSDKSSLLTFSQPIYDPSSIHVSSQVDYTENLSGVGYAPHWQGPWKGELGHGNQIESGGSSAIEKLNESSPFVFNNYINEGPIVQSGNAPRGDSGNLYGSSTVGIQMASHATSFNARIPDGKSLFSREHDADIYADPIDSDEKNRCSKSFKSMNLDGLSKSFNMMNVDGQSSYSQNLGHLASESSGTQFQGPTSPYPDFSLPGTFQGSSKCFVNNQKTYGSRESCIQPLGSFVKDPTLSVKPACTVVIKAPTKSTSSSARDTDKIVGNKLASDCGSKLQDIPNLSEENGYFMSTRPEGIEGSRYTNNSDREGNYWNYIASTSKGEVPTNSKFDDSIDFILSTRPASQITDENVSHGFSASSDYVQGYKHTQDPLENHVLLDSPCWKGAQASYSSHDNIIESLPGIQFLKELDGCLDISGNRVGLTGVASQYLSIGNPDFRAGSAANDELPSQTKTSETICAAKGLNPDDAVKEVVNCQNPQSPTDGQFLNNSGKPIKEHNFSNSFLGNETMYTSSNQYNMENGFAPVKVIFQAGTQDGETICNEAADAGAVAYLAAENVLYSPTSQEVCEEHKQPSVEVTTKRVDTSALVNAMHSLSEVLHANCSSTLYGLTEENQESLKHVIRNLDACVSRKIVNSTPVSEHMVPKQSTSISTGGDLGKVKGADQPHQKYKATVTSFGELGHQNIHHEKNNYCDYGSQARCSPCFLPSEHNKSISSDNKMVQAIKKILDENFNFEEEMQPQVLLFKNLWLEAEARMCSISYIAHFDNMRILMDKYKGKGVTDDAGNEACSKDSPNAKDTSLTGFVTENGAFPEGIITKQFSSSIDTISDNVNKSLLPRLDASFNHGDGFSSDEQHQPGVQRKTGELECRIGSVVTPNAVAHVEDLGDTFLPKLLSILKQQDGKYNNEVQKRPSLLDTKNSGCCQYGSSIGTSNLQSQFNHDEAAVLARLSMLKQRDDKLNEVQQHRNAHETNNSGYQSGSSICTSDPESQVDHAEAAALARLNVLRQRDSRPSAEELWSVGTRMATSDPESQVDHAMAAALTRLNILRQLDSISSAEELRSVGTRTAASDPESQVDHAEAAALARLNILRQRDSRPSVEELRSVSTRKAEAQLDSSVCGYGYESLKDFSQGATNDLVVQCGSNGSLGNLSGSHDSPSSGWEHVQTDYFSYQKG